MKNCPRCDAPIGDTAVACDCGWTDRKKMPKLFEKQEELRVMCCREGCENRAKVKIDILNVWHNLCIPHYDEHYRLQALDYCDALNLKTTAERREWVRVNIKLLAAKMKPFYLKEREPGEDEDFTYVQP